MGGPLLFLFFFLSQVLLVHETEEERDELVERQRSVGIPVQAGHEVVQLQKKKKKREQRQHAKGKKKTETTKRGAEGERG